MNKLISIIITGIIILNCIPVYASEYFYDESTNSDIQEIENRADYIVDEINCVPETDEKDDFESKDIDYSKMIKVSALARLFENEKIDESIIKECIKNSTYFYLLPVNCDGINLLLTINKETPLTESEYKIFNQEDIDFYENRVGEWVVPSIELTDDDVDYKAETAKILEQNNIATSNVYFISDISPSIHLAAVIFVGEDIYFKILEQSEPVDEDNESGYIPFDKNILYSYAEVKAVVDKEIEEYIKLQELYGDEELIIGTGMPNLSQTEEKSNNNILIISIISGVAVVAAAVIIVCVIKKKKTRNMEF